MSDDAKTMRDLRDLEQSLTEHVRQENRRHPEGAAVRLAVLEDWLGVLTRAQDVLLRRPSPPSPAVPEA